MAVALEYTLDFCCAGGGEGLPEESVAGALDPAAYGRRPHPATDDRIEAVWAERLEANPRLFDGGKFRLHSIGVRPGLLSGAGGVAAPACSAEVELRLGLTGYREYVGTNLRPPGELQALIDAGEASHGDRWAHLSNALGEEAVMMTSDSKMVLLRRSGHVATGTGRYNGPSGHPEPEAAGLEGLTPAQMGRAAVREVFASVGREIVEEVGVPEDTLQAPRLIGGMRDASGKPDLLFLVRCSLTGEEVAEAYRGASDAWESDRLLLADPHAPSEWRGRGVALTPVTEAALECLGWGGAPADDP